MYLYWQYNQPKDRNRQTAYWPTACYRFFLYSQSIGMCDIIKGPRNSWYTCHRILDLPFVLCCCNRVFYTFSGLHMCALGLQLVDKLKLWQYCLAKLTILGCDAHKLDITTLLWCMYVSGFLMRNCSWCATSRILPGAWTTKQFLLVGPRRPWDARDQTWASGMQGKQTTCYILSLALEKGICTGSQVFSIFPTENPFQPSFLLAPAPPSTHHRLVGLLVLLGGSPLMWLLSAVLGWEILLRIMC